MSKKPPLSVAEIAEIGDQICTISAQMAGFKPILESFVEDVPAEIGGPLVSLAALAEYLMNHLCALGERLDNTDNS